MWQFFFLKSQSVKCKSNYWKNKRLHLDCTCAWVEVLTLWKQIGKTSCKLFTGSHRVSAPSILIILLDFYFFDVDHFKIFIEFVTLLLLFYVLSFWPQGMWDLGSPVKVWTHITCTGRASLNHWTSRDIASIHSYFYCHHHCCSLLVLHPLRANKRNPSSFAWNIVNHCSCLFHRLSKSSKYFS